MFNFYKVFLWGFAVIAAILFSISISVNLYLQSQGVQKRISEITSRTMGRNIAIQNTFYTPWDGITLSKVTLPSMGIHDPFLEIAKVRLRIAWMPLLFQKKVVFSSVKIDEPIIKFLQKDERNLISPPAAAAISSPIPNTFPLPSNVVTPSSITTESIPQALQIVTTALKQVGSTSSLSPIPIGKIIISGGNFLLPSHKGDKPLILAEDIYTKLISTRDGRQLTGPLTCSRIMVGDTLIFKNLRTSLTYARDTLEAKPIVSSFANGQILGELRCRFGKPQSFEMKGHVEDVSLQSILKEVGYQAGGSSGFLRGNFEILNQGNQFNPHGQGALELFEGKLEPTDFLRQLGRILQIQELELPHLKKAIASFQIENDRVVFNNIFLESENLILKGSGPMKFNGRLEIDAQLLFNDRLYSKYQALIGKKLTPSSIKGYHEVGFHVTGHASHPQADLLEKLTGVQIRGNIGGFIQQLMGWPSSRSSPAAAP